MTQGFFSPCGALCCTSAWSMASLDSVGPRYRIPVVRFHGKMQVSNIRIKHPDSMLSVSSASGLALKLLVPLDLIWPGCGKQCVCLRTSCKFTPETVSPHVGVYLTSISSPGHTVCLSYALAWRRIVRHICTNERGQIQRV